MENRHRHREKEDYKLRTHLIHGNYESKKWNYDHHVVHPFRTPPLFDWPLCAAGLKACRVRFR